MFVKINGELVNTNSIAKASFDEAADWKSHGATPDLDARLSIVFVGNHPAPMSFRGDEARRLWAELNGGYTMASKLETK